MNPVNRLGLKAAGLTLGAVILLYGLYWGATRLWEHFAQPEQQTAGEALEAPAPDQDGDGLPDAFEAIYRGDPAKADTDDDGTNDFDEIAAGRDPAIAGPEDEVKPELGEDVVDTSTYTGRYLASLPKDLSRDQIMEQNRIEAFIALERGPLLPDLAAGTVKTSAAAGKEAIAAYLGQVSAAHNDQLTAVSNETIQAALETYLAGNPQELEQIVAQLETNSGILKNVAAPAEVAGLHTQLIQASEALTANTALLVGMREDFVGGLVASKNIDELGGVFAEIARQVQELEAKYEIEA